MTSEFVFFSSNPSLNHIKNRKMSSTIRHKYKYFHLTFQRAKDRRQKFHFCRLPFDVRPRNVKLKRVPFSKNQFTIVFQKRLEGLKPTSRNSELIFRKRNPLAVFLDRTSEFNIRIINSVIIAFLKRLAGSSFKKSVH